MLNPTLWISDSSPGSQFPGFPTHRLCTPLGSWQLVLTLSDPHPGHPQLRVIVFVWPKYLPLLGQNILAQGYATGCLQGAKMWLHSSHKQLTSGLWSLLLLPYSKERPRRACTKLGVGNMHHQHNSHRKEGCQGDQLHSVRPIECILPPQLPKLDSPV